MSSSFRDRLKKSGGKKDLKKQAKDQEDRKDQKGRYPTVFEVEKLPKNMEVYKMKDGDHIWDILPSFAGVDHPTMDEGSPVYVLEFFMHRGIGATKEIVICPYETYGKECPICTFQKSQFFHKKVYGMLRPSRRVAYVIWDHSTRTEEKKGPKVFECAHMYMEKHLNDLSRMPDEGGSVAFWDEGKHGQRIMFTKSGKGRDTDYTGHKFLPRKKAIPDSILDKLIDFSLDQIIKLKMSRKKIKKLFEPTIPAILKYNQSLEDSKGSDSDSGSDSDKGSKRDKGKDKKAKKEKKRLKAKKAAYIEKYGSKKGKKKFEKKYGKKSSSSMGDDVPF